ncbi:ABC-type transport auxiliary lipoprotein family protein [Nitratireductor basaltis]|uniref:ABC transporter auxiliary component-like protein n=1 Tax=Nitratireductor basaltis TaxID=472175 RepID=A0A084UAV2_9HYPH|nr:ABC-type transport auxiliary lipoprotein family protein [Nitratireductor basaltis]KFB10088.1 ABC transporter auxiliary component-like protein [Nitratireductor basaltis]
MRLVYAAGGLLATAFLSACSAIPGFSPPPVDAIDLSAPALIQTARAFPRRQILIAEPSALKLLDGEDIVIRTGEGTVQLLNGVRWTDRLPQLIQARLAEAFQKTDSFGGVGLPGQGLAIDYQVVTDIRAFEIRTGASETTYVELFVRIVDDRNGVVRASRSVVAVAPVSGTGSAAYRAAFNTAFETATVEIVDWVVSSL